MRSHGGKMGRLSKAARSTFLPPFSSPYPSSFHSLLLSSRPLSFIPLHPTSFHSFLPPLMLLPPSSFALPPSLCSSFYIHIFCVSLISPTPLTLPLALFLLYFLSPSLFFSFLALLQVISH